MKTAEDEMQDKIERHAQEVQMLKLQGYVGVGITKQDLIKILSECLWGHKYFIQKPQNHSIW